VETICRGRGRPRRPFVDIGVRPRDQASKSKIQGERLFVEPGDRSSSKETVRRETRLFVEGGRRVFVAGEGVHCRRGCALQERAFVAGEGIHCRRGYSLQEGGGCSSHEGGGRPSHEGGGCPSHEGGGHSLQEEAIRRTREEAVCCRREEAFR